MLPGATGYVGSLVLEQLLRVCPDVRAVYVSIRPKWGANEQVSDFFCCCPSTARSTRIYV